MSNLQEYKRLLKKWRRKYKDQIPKKELNFAAVTAERKCVWCGKVKGAIHRHHTGNDFEFAKLRPDVFAARYVQFLEEDTEMLCDKCHEDAHWWMAPIMHEFRQAFNAALYRKADEETIVLLCKEYMKRCREEFYRILEEEPRR